MLYSNSCLESLSFKCKKKKIDIRIFYSKLYIELMEFSKMSKIDKDIFHRIINFMESYYKMKEE